ncbi:MAG: DUF1501 domain-containing protein, partial [Planctomycetota bacterium]|nr:DUF1501 domain-containing protein [Planctomycetota bacterium]
LALATLLRDQGLLADDAGATPLAAKRGQFPAKAKACIYIYLEGAPSQIDLFDPKPKLNELDGQPLPESMTENVRFAFLQKETARLMGCPRTFKPHGQCGTELSDYLPHLATCVDEIALVRSMHTEAFNHHPGQLLLNTGSQMFGRPSIGSWLAYGLGAETQNLPGFVVLTAGRGTSGGTSNWGSGFLPSSFAGVLFRNQGEPVLNLANPAGVSSELQAQTIAGVTALNRQRLAALHDPEIASRIAAYELAHRMQTAAPELIDLSGETKETQEAYGLGRPEPELGGWRGGPKGCYEAFARNCLLARRLVERGVRFVNLVHASWDHHSDLDGELGLACQMADQPVAALIKDLKQRGLLDSTLVVWASEFGRTPLGENRKGYEKVTGRDHHPFAFSLWCAGGGIKGAQVIGKTDDIGWGIVEDPVHVHDLQATFLHLFGIDHLKLTYRFQGRDFRLTDVGGKVVEKLLGST